MSKKKFVPMKVQFRQEEHKRALSDAEAKLKLINEGLKWCEKHVDIESIDRKGFLLDMEKEFDGWSVSAPSALRGERICCSPCPPAMPQGTS